MDKKKEWPYDPRRKESEQRIKRKNRPNDPTDFFPPPGYIFLPNIKRTTSFHSHMKVLV